MRTHLALLVLPLVMCSCFLSPVGVGVDVGWMNINPTGDIGLEDAAASQPLGDIKIDVDDFNIEDAGTPYVRADLDAGDWDILLSGFFYDEESTSVLTSRFGDLPVGSAVSSDLKILNVKLAMTYDLPVPVVDVGIGVCLDFFDVQMDVRSSTPVVGFESVEFTAPVPMLYARASASLGIVSADLDVGWLSVDLGDADGSFLDVDAMVSVSPLPLLQIFAGYRFIVIDALGDVDNQNFDTDLRLEGWYFGGGVTF